MARMTQRVPAIRRAAAGFLCASRRRQPTKKAARNAFYPLWRVARIAGIPLVNGMVRVHDSPPQAALSWNARAGNVRDAFLANALLAGRRVAIVDDVMTTGATLAAAAKAARRAGAIDVAAWVVARTLPPGEVPPA